MINRKLSEQIKKYSEKFPVLAVTGPRQSGKTTLVKSVFPDYKYVNLEEIDKRQFALEDPKGFLTQFKGKLIIDEAQYAPDLFSYIQVFADNSGEMGNYVLTGSQNFLLMERISQSLAGRVAIFTLLPFSCEELVASNNSEENYQNHIFKGFYPAIYDRKLEPHEWYPNYVNTYIERDVRNTLNVANLLQFRQFMQICAGSVGQLINFSSIGNSIGVSNNTIKNWFSVLEASFVVFRLQPYLKNAKKRILKSPKLFFYDTGLVCDLLGIQSVNQLNTHYAKGALFENFIILELLKNALNRNEKQDLYFWRDSNANEIDCIVDKGDRVVPIEIKSAQTISTSFFKGLDRFDEIYHTQNKTLVYGGEEDYQRTSYNILSWKSLASI